MLSWIYGNAEYELPPGADHKTIQGFVYLITNTNNGKKYVGKKFFWSSKQKQVKGKKKKFKVESDWKTYCGSSETLRMAIKTDGIENFKREILHICLSKAECSFYESHEIFARGALLKPEEYMNEWISCKIRRAHLSRIIKENT